MEPRITARRCKLSPTDKDAISGKLTKLTQYYDGITDVQVVIEKDTASIQPYNAEIIVNVFRQQLAGTASDSTFEAAVDACVDRLRRQLLKYKSRLRRKH